LSTDCGPEFDVYQCVYAVTPENNNKIQIAILTLLICFSWSGSLLGLVFQHELDLPLHRSNIVANIADLHPISRGSLENACREPANYRHRHLRICRHIRDVDPPTETLQVHISVAGRCGTSEERNSSENSLSLRSLCSLAVPSLQRAIRFRVSI
jgi:hypothetical protein